MIELTEEQLRALETDKKPVQVLNPRTKEIFVLVRQDVYQLASHILSGPNRNGWDNPADDDLIRKTVALHGFSS